MTSPASSGSSSAVPASLSGPPGQSPPFYRNPAPNPRPVLAGPGPLGDQSRPLPPNSGPGGDCPPFLPPQVPPSSHLMSQGTHRPPIFPPPRPPLPGAVQADPGTASHGTNVGGESSCGAESHGSEGGIGFARQGSQEGTVPPMYSGGVPPQLPSPNRPPGELNAPPGFGGHHNEIPRTSVSNSQGMNRPYSPAGEFRPPLSGVGQSLGQHNIRPSGMGPSGDARPPEMGVLPRPTGPPGEVRPPGVGGASGLPGIGQPTGEIRPSGIGGHPQPSGPPGEVRPPGMGGLPRPSGPPGAVRPTGMGDPLRPSGPPGEVRPPEMGAPQSSGLPGEVPPPGMGGPPRPSGPPGEAAPSSGDVKSQGIGGPGPPRMGGMPPGPPRRGGPPLLPGPRGEMRPPRMMMGGPPRMPGMLGPPGPMPAGMAPNFPPMNRPPRFPDGPRPLMRHPGPFPPGHFPPDEEVWFEHHTVDGKVYYSHSKTQKTVWERPNAHILPFGSAQARPDQGIIGNSPGASFPPTFPPGFPPSLPGNPQLVPTRVWSTHQTPEGRTYFYNKVTKQSVWEQPKDFELIMPLPLSFSTSMPASASTGKGSKSIEGEKSGAEKGEEGGSGGGVASEKSTDDGGKQIEGPVPTDDPGSDMETESPSKPSPAYPQGMPPPGPSTILQAPPPPQPNFPPPPPALFGPPMQIPMAAPVPQPEPKGPHPIASIPVPGTPWSVVWSSDDRTFFFNATNHSSVWSTPEDLIGNEALEKILDNPPGGKKRPGVLKDGPHSKRLKMSDSEDSDEDEKITIEGVSVVKGDTKAPAADEGAQAAEMAAKARATIPLEKRQQDFKEMLLERGVSAFSTWEKELPKFVFDPRYMLLTVKERKACFQAFIRSRTEEERRERKSKLKEMKEQFRSLLEGAKLTPKSSFSEFAARHGKDERFKAVEKMREREQMFTEFLGELKRAGSRTKDEQKGSVKGKVEKVKQDFLTMLKEQKEEAITEDSQWKKVKGSFSNDPRYKAVDGSSKREEFFAEYVQSLKGMVQELDPEQTRQERIQASLKEREREVQMSRSAQEKEWDRERDQLRKMEAHQNFKALLVDTVRVPQLQWHEAKRNMKRDHRWELTRLLDHEEKELIFQEHVLELANKKRLQFRKLLEETPQITLSLPWRKARKLIKEDVRYKSFTDSDYKREVEYDRYQMDRLTDAKSEFRLLLRETKIITYKSFDLVNESDKHYNDIINVLKNDKRFLVLDCIPGERDGMLMEHLEEISRKGPPPPPTASYPGERLKRPGP